MVGAVDAAGPAARLWRNVYKKAAEAAEARLLALVRDHVYLFHRTTGEGGAAGALTLVETQTLPDDTTVQCHFTTIPAEGAGLLLVISAFQKVAGGAGSLLLRFNDDATSNYYSKWHEVTGSTATPVHQTTGGPSPYLPLGRLSIIGGVGGGDADPPGSIAGIVAFLPGHGLPGRRKHVLSLGSAFTNTTTHYFGQYGGEWRGTGAITKITLYPSGTEATLGGGSVFTLYQLTQTAPAALGVAAPTAAAPAVAGLQEEVTALRARVAALEGAGRGVE